MKTRGDHNKIPASACLVLAASKSPPVIRDLHVNNFSFDSYRPYRRRSRCELRRVVAGDAKDCYAREPRNGLLEQPNQFPAQLWKIKKHPGQIAARAREAFDISQLNGIALQVYPNDRNAARCVPSRNNRLWSVCENDVHFEPNKIASSLIH